MPRPNLHRSALGERFVPNRFHFGGWMFHNLRTPFLAYIHGGQLLLAALNVQERVSVLPLCVHPSDGRALQGDMGEYLHSFRQGRNGRAHDNRGKRVRRANLRQGWKGQRGTKEKGGKCSKPVAQGWKQCVFRKSSP